MDLNVYSNSPTHLPGPKKMMLIQFDSQSRSRARTHDLSLRHCLESWCNLKWNFPALTRIFHQGVILSKGQYQENCHLAYSLGLVKYLPYTSLRVQLACLIWLDKDKKLTMNKILNNKYIYIYNLNLRNDYVRLTKSYDQDIKFVAMGFAILGYWSRCDTLTLEGTWINL